jgi:hypothetical protein
METVARLSDWLTAALLVPEVRLKLVPLGLRRGLRGTSSQIRFGRAIPEANIKAD